MALNTIMLFIFIAVAGFVCVSAASVLQKNHEYWKTEVLSPTWREALTVAALVAAYDIFVYRGSYAATFYVANAGFSAFFFAIPLLIFAGLGVWKCWRSRKFWVNFTILTFMMWAAAAKILYSGFIFGFGACFCACILLVLLSAAVSETEFRIAPFSRYAASSLWIAFPRMCRYFLLIFQSHRTGKFTGGGCAAVAVPLGIVFLFGGIFVKANPGLMAYFDAWNAWILAVIEKIDWTLKWLPHFSELCLWGLLGTAFAGLLAVRKWKPEEEADEVPEYIPEGKDTHSPYFSMFLNTLIGVAAIFGVNLFYEAYSRVTWNPPAGFCFGTYCHEGAAWLTTALALTTLILAAIFSKRTYRDSRISVLKILAAVWIFENVLLAAFIYVRLGIYVQQTGLTWLRIVGFFGTTTVIGGLLWMAVKVFRKKNFSWLLRRYIFMAAVLFWLYSVLPIDAIVWRWNTDEILAGNQGPLMHLAEQDISPEGWVQIMPLLCSEEPEIRRGTAAILRCRVPGFFLNSGYSEENVLSKDWRQYDYADASLRSQMKFYHEQIFKRYSDENPNSDFEMQVFRNYCEKFYK